MGSVIHTEAHCAQTYLVHSARSNDRAEEDDHVRKNAARLCAFRREESELDQAWQHVSEIDGRGAAYKLKGNPDVRYTQEREVRGRQREDRDTVEDFPRRIRAASGRTVSRPFLQQQEDVLAHPKVDEREGERQRDGVRDAHSITNSRGDAHAHEISKALANVILHHVRACLSVEERVPENADGHVDHGGTCDTRARYCAQPCTCRLLDLGDDRVQVVVADERRHQNRNRGDERQRDLDRRAVERREKAQLRLHFAACDLYHEKIHATCRRHM